MDTVKKKILIADDDEAICECIALWLQEFDWDVVRAKSASEVLKQKNQFWTYIIDLRLKDMDGIKVAEALHNRFDKPNIVLISGYLDDRLRQSAHKHGVRATLKKPFHFDELNEILKKLTGDETPE